MDLILSSDKCDYAVFVQNIETWDLLNRFGPFRLEESIVKSGPEHRCRIEFYFQVKTDTESSYLLNR